VAEGSPYPDARDFRLDQVDRRLDRIEQRLDAMQELNLLKNELGYVRRDIEKLDRKVDEHIATVKPLIAADAGRSGFSTGIKAWIQYGLLTLVVVAGLLLNVLVAAGVFK
jgi:tetrahydromethanopterin S-methyltransferase subunit G